MATTVPRFHLVPTAWDIVVGGEHRGVVVDRSWQKLGPRKFFATHGGESVYGATRDEAVTKLLEALSAEGEQ